MNCLYTLSTELKRMLDVPFHRFHDSEAAHFFRLLYTSLPVPQSSGIHVESMELDLSDDSTERERAQAHEERLQRYEEQISDIKRYKEDLTRTHELFKETLVDNQEQLISLKIKLKKTKP